MQEQKPTRSFSVALAQMAHILRSEVKLKDKNTTRLSSTNPGSLNNLIMQVAKLLRTQLHTPAPRKRSWKHTTQKK